MVGFSVVGNFLAYIFPATETPEIPRNAIKKISQVSEVNSIL